MIWTYGEKLEIGFCGDFFGGVFWNFGFGLRKKSWEFGFLGWGGYSGTSDLDLGKKVGNLDFWYGGVFWNFGFGLRKKKLEIWIFGMGGYSGTSDLDLGKKVGNLDFWDGGGILELWIWT